jgi:hypothetical protein
MTTKPPLNEQVNAHQIPVVKNPDNIRAVYANNAGFGATMTDVQIVFTQVTQGTDANEELCPENRVVSIVTIPISQVSQAISGLSQLLKIYESNVASLQKHVEQQTSTQSN